MKPIWIAILLLIPCVAFADEWGSWDDLPDNLLQDTDALVIMDELDRLFASNTTNVDGELDSWLNQLNLRFNITEDEFEALLAELNESEAERLEEWLEDQLELQEEALELKEEDEEDDEFEDDDEDEEEDDE